MATFEETSIGYKAIFQKTYNDAVAKADILATTVTSNSLSEEYAWLGSYPGIREWIGDRVLKTLSEHGYTIKNKAFEGSVTVPKKYIEYDKIGLFRPAIEQMAVNAKNFPGTLVAQIVVDATDAVKGKCFDGLPFYSTAHKIGTTTYANTGVGVLNNTNLIAAEAFMMSIDGDSGQNLGICPDTLVVGPKSLALAIQAIEKETLTNGEANTTYKRYKLLVLPEIKDMKWHLMDLSKPLKPFIKQVAADAKFTASNDHAFMKDAALFGVDSFLNAGYGMWHLSYMGTGLAT